MTRPPSGHRSPVQKQVLVVLFCQTGNGHIGIRQVHSFPAAQHTRWMMRTVTLSFVGVSTCLLFCHRLSGWYRRAPHLCKGRIGDIHLFIITEQFFGGDDEFCILFSGGRFSSTIPNWILGPCRSARMATYVPRSLLIFRISFIVFLW